MIAHGLVLLVAGVAASVVVALCDRGDRGGVSWFDLALIPLNRAGRRRGLAP